jgi:hypothetical protein
MIKNKKENIRKGSSEPIRRVCHEFAEELDRMKELRLKIGKDDIKNISADWRLTLALIRHPLFIKIKEDIIGAELK